MREVAVAFPRDEVSAQVLASRLRAAGLWARVDRGLYGSWQVGSPNQITVLTDSATAGRAREILGVADRGVPAGTVAPKIVIAMGLVALALGLIALAGMLFR